MAEVSRPEHVEGQSQANEVKNEGAVYEVALLIVPSLDEDAAAAAFARVHKALGKDAAVLAEELPKRISLAYQVERSTAGRREKYTEAYFGFIKFELPEDGAGEAVQKLGGTLSAETEVLRHLLIKTSREAPMAPRNIFSSKTLEGRTIEKPVAMQEDRGPVDEGELDKSIDALVGEEKNPADTV